MYKDSGLTININGRSGKTVLSQTGVKQGCPLSPTLFGLYIDGMHRFLMASGPVDVPVLSLGVQVTDLAYADDVALMAESPQGLQRLNDLVCEFCVFMGMVVGVVKTKVMVFNLAFPGPFQWTCGGEQLEIVMDFKYLGILFNALDGMAVTFPMLKKNMFGAWALLKRQYGRLQCLASVGLMFRVYEACVPSTASYGCEIWGFQPFPQQYRILRKSLITSHLQMLKEITGVRGSTSTDILLAELGLKSPDHVWLLRAAKFWNNLAGKPSGNLYRCIALDCCKGLLLQHQSAIGHGPCSRQSMLPGTSTVFAVMTWMSLISLPYGSTSCNSVILSGKTLISARGLALVRGLDAAHMLDGLQDLHIDMLALYWIFLFLLQA